MGFNFRKTINLGHGLKLNIGKKSASVSVGTKGVRHSISTTGKQTTTFSLPGTGISYSTHAVSDLLGKKTSAAGKTAKKDSAKPKTAKKSSSAKAKTTVKAAAAPKTSASAKPAASPAKPSSETPSNPFSTGRASKTHD